MVPGARVADNEENDIPTMHLANLRVFLHLVKMKIGGVANPPLGLPPVVDGEPEGASAHD